MIETNNPEINVDELMVKVREEVARQRAGNAASMPQPFPPEAPVAAVDWPRVYASLHAAEHYAPVGNFVPGWARFGRLRRSLARLTARFVLYLSGFITNQQKQFNVSAAQSLQAIGDGLRNLDSRLIERDERLGGLETTIRGLEGSVTALGQGQQGGLQRVESELVQREGRVGELEETVGSLRSSVTLLEQVRQEYLHRLEDEITRRDGRTKELERKLFHLKAELILQERRITLLLEEARKRLPEPFDQQQLQVLAEENKHRLDALYVSFEDQFRGTREDIKERLKVYPPLIKEAGIGTELMPILDLGCGRGEWLEVLREEGLLARGLDINHVLVGQCQRRGFEVVEGDVITCLRSLPDASLGAVTGFHIIEHLLFDSFITLLDETVRVLKPEGVAIFETPNPQNVLVGSCNFYLDPTHRNPLPSPTVKFLAEARGLCRVEILNLHPFPEAFRLNGSALAQRFSEHFYGPQDYAVIGWKM